METKTKFVSNTEPNRIGFGEMTASEMGKRGGSIKSIKKAKSSRENGKKGGRPKKKV
jgi:hypothetical protein